MQALGYLKINGQITKVLYRSGKNCIYMKLRIQGDLGKYLEDEEKFLKDRPSLKYCLLAGKTIIL